MRRQIVAELWDSYARSVLPSNAPTVQRWECRRAFYAGCEGLLRAVEKALDAGQDATEADLVVMVGIDQELREFVKNVKEGRA